MRRMRAVKETPIHTGEKKGYEGPSKPPSNVPWEVVDASAAPPLEVPQRMVANMEPSLYAVFEECRRNSLITACYLSSVLDIAMRRLEESAEVVLLERDEGDSCHDCGHNCTNCRRAEGTLGRSVADAVMGTDEAEDSPFIHFLGDNPNTSIFSMLHVDPDGSSSASGLGHDSESTARRRSRRDTGLRSISTAAINGERDSSLFPNPNGHWECGIFRGKRVYIEAGSSCIGRGATAKVYEGHMVVGDVIDGKEVCLVKVPVAIKEIVFNAKERIVRELYKLAVSIRLHMVHPGIVHSYYAGIYLPHIAAICEAERAMLHGHLVLARSVTGSVADVLKRAGSFAEVEIRRCMGEILSALQCIHEDHRCVHNDVKPHNILIFDDPSMYYADVKYQITDLTGIAPARPFEDILQDLGNTTRSDNVFVAGGGTAVYMSPESCLGLGTVTSNDVWSLGITAFHMATGTLPWKPMERQYPSMILNGYRQKFSLRGLLECGVGEVRKASVRCSMQGASMHAPEGGNTLPDTSVWDTSVGSDAMGSSTCTTRAFREEYKEFGPILDALDDVDVSAEFRSFLAQCLIENPIERPTCRQLRSHPFLKDTNVAAHH